MAILRDGFNTTITLPGAGVTFVEKEVTPPALDGGGEINITAMRNVRWRTRAPKYLITVDKLHLKVQYDPIAYGFNAGLRVQINNNQSIILNFPTLGGFGGNNAPLGQTFQFMGWLNKFAPEATKEGEEPLADMEVIPSMQTAGVETDPVATPTN